MEKIERTNAPDWLKKNWEKWGGDWAAKCAETDKKPTFHWLQHKKKAIKTYWKFSLL